jgi:3-oxoacyl-[acyl-carrier protein] reductase
LPATKSAAILAPQARRDHRPAARALARAGRRTRQLRRRQHGRRRNGGAYPRARRQSRFEAAQSAFGKIDIAVANAGLELTGLPVSDFTEEQYDRMFAVNTKGAFFTMQSAAKHVTDNGRIIYVSSSTTGYPMPGYALHGGSKVAPQYLVQVLAHEVGPRGIAVNAIVPTATEGAGLHVDVEDGAPIKKFAAGFIPMGRMGTPDDVANVAEFFASELSGFVSGQLLMVSGGGLA